MREGMQISRRQERRGGFTMKVRVSMRSVLRWVHIILAIPIYGYIYSPFEKLPQYARPTRFVFFPLMVVTGLLMWKGHLLRRMFVKRPT
jgi:thiosulfate reductase cytochrome b subunit